jgi:hypothetical protein
LNSLSAALGEYADAQAADRTPCRLPTGTSSDEAAQAEAVETNRHGRTWYPWRFEDHKYWIIFYDDPEEARADATTQITEQINGS